MCDINSICRVCKATEKLQNLFVPKNDFLVTMLRRVADIQISDDDPLPKHICLPCSSRLGIAYDFKMQCEATDRLLRKEYSNAFIKQLNEIIIKEEIEECHDKSEDIVIREYLEDGGEFKIEIDSCSIGNLFEDINNDKRFDSRAEASSDDHLNNSNSKESPKDIRGDHPLGNPKETHSEIRVTNYEINTSHQTTTANKKRFQCPICQKYFSKKDGMLIHMGIHQGIKFPCPHCDRQYSNDSNLRRHVKVFHEKIRNFGCTVCGQRFGRKVELERHSSVHTSEKNYSCDKKFKSAYHLRIRRNLHDGSSRPLRKQTRHPKKLYKHKYTCNICGKRLSPKNYFTHMRSHRGERPFKCPQCEMCFSSKAHVIRHQITHTNEKPFVIFAQPPLDTPTRNECID